MQSTYPPTEVPAPAPHVVQQPSAKAGMNMQSPAQSTQEEQEHEPLRLRGGCPGKFCGLPILPCRINICIFPIPCC